MQKIKEFHRNFVIAEILHLKSENYTYEELRSLYPEFIYHGYEFVKSPDSLRVTYHFEVPGLCAFRPVMDFPERSFIQTGALKDEQLDLLLFNIGMIELVSYWKATCSPQVKILPGKLTEEQVLWWKNVYYQGLGEFYYLNEIAAHPDHFMEIHCESEKVIEPFALPRYGNVLVPIGGGKDSVVTLELLKEHGFRVRPLIMNPRGATLSTARAGGFDPDQCVIINRSIDPELLRLNARGFLNGHTPFSAMLAFYSLLAAALTGHSTIALSNEASANEATIRGTDINHQYSKSYEFERDFRNYVERYITRDLDYFSFLRPLHEIQIARLFSSYPHYWPVFKSCNAGSKTNVWCGACAKCLFAYIILSPFIPVQSLIKIFGHDLLDDPGLMEFFKELTGISENKPFECIGTVDEVNLALHMTLQLRTEALPALLKYYAEQHLQSIPSHDLLKEINPVHFLPAPFIEILRQKIHD